MGREPRRAARIEAHVERQHDPLRPEVRSQAAHFVRLGHGDAADDDAGHAERKQLVRHLAAAHAAADLDRDLRVGRGERPMASRLPCEPSRAPSRSTTWISFAPSAR